MSRLGLPWWELYLLIKNWGGIEKLHILRWWNLRNLYFSVLCRQSTFSFFCFFHRILMHNIGYSLFESCLALLLLSLKKCVKISLLSNVIEICAIFCQWLMVWLLLEYGSRCFSFLNLGWSLLAKLVTWILLFRKVWLKWGTRNKRCLLTLIGFILVLLSVALILVHL